MTDGQINNALIVFRIEKHTICSEMVNYDENLN